MNDRIEKWLYDILQAIENIDSYIGEGQKLLNL